MAWMPTLNEMENMDKEYRKRFERLEPLFEAMPEEDQERYWEIVRECLKTGVPYDESRYVDPWPTGPTEDGWAGSALAAREEANKAVWLPTKEERIALWDKYRDLFGWESIYPEMPYEDRARYWEIVRACVETGKPYESRRKGEEVCCDFDHMPCKDCMHFMKDADAELASYDDCIVEGVDIWGRRYYYCYMWKRAQNIGKPCSRDSWLEFARIPDEIVYSRVKCPYFLWKYPPEGAEELWKLFEEGERLKK